MKEVNVCRLALIVGAARSGTTLLRLILDAHPEVGCPAEAGLPGLMSHMAGVWMTVDVDAVDGGDGGDPGADGIPAGADGEIDALRRRPGARAQVRFGDLPPEARNWIRETVLLPMRRYAGRGAKCLYVDKSLDSVFHLELVNDLFPTACYVLLFRHVMDTVASGIEASPWGFQAYGYGPYVQAQPGNAVAALASYWLDHVTKALAWEEEHPEISHRVRYEDLVLRSEETIAGIQAFLGIKEDLSVLARAFDRAPPRGPGDYKVEHTTAVHASSIGHGKRVPVGMLPPALLTALNEKLAALGYESLDRRWNAAERPVDGGAQGIWANRLVELMDGTRVSAEAGELRSFAVVAEDHRALRWVIDAAAGTVERGDGEVDSVLTGTAETLVLALSEQENLGVLLRSGRLRHIVADEDQAAQRDLIRELGLIVDAMRSGSRPPGRDEEPGHAVA